MLHIIDNTNSWSLGYLVFAIVRQRYYGWRQASNGKTRNAVDQRYSAAGCVFKLLLQFVVIDCEKVHVLETIVYVNVLSLKILREK